MAAPEKRIQKILLASTLCLIFLSGCAINTEKRAEIILWASEIALIEDQLAEQVNAIQPVIDAASRGEATLQDMNQLLAFSTTLTNLSGQITAKSFPDEAKYAQETYIKNYARIADYGRYFYLAASQFSVEYLEQSRAAIQEANQLGDEAYYAFQSLLEKYKITCEDIDDCE
jgi:outer membrane murein-binding lipoprotein Lpp